MILIFVQFNILTFAGSNILFSRVSLKLQIENFYN